MSDFIIKNLIKNSLSFMDNIDLDDLKNYEEINNIVLKNLYLYETKDIKGKYINLSKSIKLVSSFLRENNNNYNQELINKYNKNQIIFDISNSDIGGYYMSPNFELYDCTEKQGAYSWINPKTLKNEIYLPIQYTAYDSSALVHELFHELNYYNLYNVESASRLYLTEAVSISSEFFFENYLKNNEIPNYQIGVEENLRFTEYASNSINTKIKILYYYLKNKDFNSAEFYDLYKISEEDVLAECITCQLEFRPFFRYIIGIILSQYINEFRTLEKLNESINRNTIEESLSKIGIVGKQHKEYIKYNDKTLDEFDQKIKSMYLKRGELWKK